MGLLDHNKTWHFTITGSPDACLSAFSTALSSGKSSLSLKKAKWSVRRGTSAEGNPMAMGEYQGRAGVTGAITTMSQRASDEEAAAVGSKIAFEVTSYDPQSNRCTCAMWLQSASTHLGFKNDARFFRSYMSTVADQLRKLDPSLTVNKS
jgi:hypothetical protein